MFTKIKVVENETYLISNTDKNKLYNVMISENDRFNIYLCDMLNNHTSYGNKKLTIDKLKIKKEVFKNISIMINPKQKFVFSTVVVSRRGNLIYSYDLSFECTLNTKKYDNDEEYVFLLMCELNVDTSTIKLNIQE